MKKKTNVVEMNTAKGRTNEELERENAVLRHSVATYQQALGEARQIAITLRECHTVMSKWPANVTAQAQ